MNPIWIATWGCKSIWIANISCRWTMVSLCVSGILRRCCNISPRMLEFHFTDQDLDEQYPGQDFSEKSGHPMKLVVHAPEFWDRTLVDLCSLDERHRAASCDLIQKSINLTRKIAPFFVGKPKVIIHPGAMSLDHPIQDRRGAL